MGNWLLGSKVRAVALTLVPLATLAGCGAGDATLTEELPDGVVNPSGLEQGLDVQAPCRTPLAEFDGIVAYSNGRNTGTGVSCAGYGDFGYLYQCVELAMRYYRVKFGLSWRGNAKDLLVNAPRDRVDVFSNGDAAHPPRPGDMLVWTQGRYGHVAIVTAVRDTAVDIIEQNVTGSGLATLPYANGLIGGRWSSNWVPRGWARPKGVGPASAGAVSYVGGSPTAGWTPEQVDFFETWKAQLTSLPEDTGGLRRLERVVSVKTLPDWTCGKSSYRGTQFWTCSGSEMFKCDAGGKPHVIQCASGCASHGLGRDDACQ